MDVFVLIHFLKLSVKSLDTIDEFEVIGFVHDETIPNAIYIGNVKSEANQ
jgi:hypothetical protein